MRRYASFAASPNVPRLTVILTRHPPRETPTGTPCSPKYSSEIRGALRGPRPTRTAPRPPRSPGTGVATAPACRSRHHLRRGRCPTRTPWFVEDVFHPIVPPPASLPVGHPAPPARHLLRLRDAHPGPQRDGHTTSAGTAWASFASAPWMDAKTCTRRSWGLVAASRRTASHTRSLTCWPVSWRWGVTSATAILRIG